MTTESHLQENALSADDTFCQEAESLLRQLLARYGVTRDIQMEISNACIQVAFPTIDPVSAIPHIVIRGDRFINEHGQYVISGRHVYRHMPNDTWHLSRHGLSSADRASLRLVERGYEINVAAEKNAHD